MKINTMPTLAIKFANASRVNYQPSTQQPIAVLPLTPSRSSNVLTPANIISATALAGAIGVGTVYFIRNKKTYPPYLEELAQGLSAKLHKKIKPSSLTSVMSAKELLTELPKLNKENYVFSEANIKQGIFQADLHSHSNFSDGKASVETIMEQVSKYADYLYAKTKKKFIYALSDHTNFDGVEKALEIIANNPKKFSNVRFVPAAELSYAYPSPKASNPCETAEVLAYGINPFSQNTKNFVSNIYAKRSNMVDNFLQDLKNLFPSVTFNKQELQKFYSIDDLYAMNLQWRVYHYGQTKTAIADFAKKQNTSAENLYNEIMNKINKHSKTLFDVQTAKLIPDNYTENNRILELARKYSPQVENNNISAAAENKFEDIVNFISKERDGFLAFAHPGYMRLNMGETPALTEFLSVLISKSKGLVKAFEEYHQTYKPNVITDDIVKEVNSSLRQKGLAGLGGRDCHEADWMKFLPI
ncbi:MAG: hypothetical protein PHX18_01380 [Candidatus Gastranaerophilales bacterium]|nr:hypothetical protein [Candidatus Gastranaerophilales bacterium]